MILARPRFFSRSLLAIICALGLAGCATSWTVAPLVPVPGPAASVTRAEALGIAEACRSHRWTPAEQNLRHGLDKKGVRVDTPDALRALDPGCQWRPGVVQQGLPYKWGGFDTPEQFDTRLAAGQAAGDIETEEKRALDNDAVSEEAAGIDCSGLVSRAWRLSRPHDTRTLPTLCVPLGNLKELKPGDIVNVPGYHTILFVRWTREGHMVGYHAAGKPWWGVHLSSISREHLDSMGYVPMRYRGMRD